MEQPSHALTPLTPSAGAPMPRSPCWQGCSSTSLPPYRAEPQTPPQLAATLGVGAGRLRLLLYALVAAGLLTEQDGCFANTPEAQHFLVQGTPTSLGPLHHNLAAQWAFKLHTAASIRTGRPPGASRFCPGVPRGRRSVPAAHQRGDGGGGAGNRRRAMTSPRPGPSWMWAGARGGWR